MPNLHFASTFFSVPCESHFRLAPSAWMKRDSVVCSKTLQSPTWHSTGRSEWTLINFYLHVLSSFSSLSAACPVGYFKSVSGSVPCLVCPSNSRTSQEGSSVCECRSSFYRSANDANSSACTSELCWFVCLRQALWEAFKGPLWPFVIYSDCENEDRVTDQKSSCFSTI